MANVLEFALGLQTSEFLSKLGFAEGELLSFAGVAELVRKAWERTWDAMERGAELRGLASAVGETVSQLYRFQHGLEAVGAPAENARMLLMMTEKALSGVNDAGQRTDILFSKIGLNLAQLRRMDTIDALKQISAALGSLNNAQAAGVAESLFGRFNAAAVLQISRDMGTFTDAMNHGGQTGAQLQKFADVFRQVKNDWDDIAGDMLGFWTAVGGKIAPEMHAVLREVDTGIRIVMQSLTDGKFGQLFGLTLQVGAEYAGSFIEGYFGSANFWKGIFDNYMGEFLLATSALENVVVQFAVFFQTSLQYAVDAVFNLFGKRLILLTADLGRVASIVDPIAGKALTIAAAGMAAEFGLNGGGGQSFGALFGQNENALNNILGPLAPGALGLKGLGLTGDAITDTARALQDAAKNANAPDAGRLSALAKALLGAADASGTGGAAGMGLQNLDLAPSHFHPEFTSLERMGFIMSGAKVEDPYKQRQTDLLQQIANNTSARENPNMHPFGPPSSHQL